jgi:hypothetical protein
LREKSIPPPNFSDRFSNQPPARRKLLHGCRPAPQIILLAGGRCSVASRSAFCFYFKMHSQRFLHVKIGIAPLISQAAFRRKPPYPIPTP